MDEEASTTLKPLKLLERVAEMEHPAALAELALTTRLPKPTLHRWLRSLEKAGLLQRTLDGRRYELGGRASQLALSILSNRQGSVVRHEILRGLAEALRESCNLTILHGTQVVYIDRVESMWPLRITFQPGSKVPAYCSASGKLFLALMPASKRDLLLRELRFERFTEHTLVDAPHLLEELKTVRKQGYALDHQEYLPGLICLAVPIRKRSERTRSCVAALAVQAPVARLSLDDMLKHLPTLQSAAENISSSFY